MSSASCTAASRPRRAGSGARGRLLARRDAQIEDLSRRLADSLTSLSVERGERELSQRDMAAMKKARTWRLMARLYFAIGRLRSAFKAPVRLARDLSQRVRRRIRAL